VGSYKDRLPEYKSELPENFDPNDPDLKKRFNINADDMNYISCARKYPYLACGATKKTKKKCAQPAGYGTKHTGYGRCKHHGGSCTGPKTEEGKAASSKNSVVHGLFSKALLPGEKEYFDSFVNQEVGLEFEIALMKSKIVHYLTKNADKWKRAYDDKQNLGELKAAEAADKETRVFYSVVSEDDEGEQISRKTHYYHAGTIEDKPLIRALETLGRLVDKHAKLKGLNKTDADNILDQINAELRGASFGQVSLSWGGKPQTREEK
jgi:hypothetical protein